MLPFSPDRSDILFLFYLKRKRFSEEQEVSSLTMPNVTAPLNNANTVYKIVLLSIERSRGPPLHLDCARCGKLD